MLAQDVRNEMQNDDSNEEPEEDLEDLTIEDEEASRPPKRKRAGDGKTTRGEHSNNKTTSAAKTGQNWAILEPIWPASERPEALRNPSWIESQSIEEI